MGNVVAHHLSHALGVIGGDQLPCIMKPTVHAGIARFLGCGGTLEQVNESTLIGLKALPSHRRSVPWHQEVESRARKFSQSSFPTSSAGGVQERNRQGHQIACRQPNEYEGCIPLYQPLAFFFLGSRTRIHAAR